ncbi:MAG TPA: MerR family transcriptional regulator [Actinomycetota bacterium]|nr:MerR family transcriptional regulator [Actinomycetota bacterium]
MSEVRSPIYSIGAVSRMLGVPVSTLRTWEERYGTVIPDRSPGGQRLYSRLQIESLRRVCGWIEQGMSPSEAHRLLAERTQGQRNEPFPAPESLTLRILLAERDPYAADMAEYLLKTEGFEVVLALDADDARRAVRDHPADVAIVELLISGGAGFDLCRELRGGGVSRIVAVSQLDARDEALAAGADAFLRKPLEPLTLLATVKDVIGTSAFLRSPGGARV